MGRPKRADMFMPIPEVAGYNYARPGELVIKQGTTYTRASLRQLNVVQLIIGVERLRPSVL